MDRQTNRTTHTHTLKTWVSSILCKSLQSKKFCKVIKVLRYRAQLILGMGRDHIFALKILSYENRGKDQNSENIWSLLRTKEPIFGRMWTTCLLMQNTKFYGRIHPNYAIICHVNDFYHICWIFPRICESLIHYKVRHMIFAKQWCQYRDTGNTVSPLPKIT